MGAGLSEIKKRLLVVGNDKIGRWCLYELSRSNVNMRGIEVAIDRSSDKQRVLKLLLKRYMPFRCFTLMVLAELRREEYECDLGSPSIRSNYDLYNKLASGRYERAFLFRAGLIINKRNISAGVPIINVHCARIPEYGGLCSIYRAIEEGAYRQEATMHRVTTKIDDASHIFATEPYSLDPSRDYGYNEKLAYQAGIRLVINKIESI